MNNLLLLIMIDENVQNNDTEKENSRSMLRHEANISISIHPTQNLTHLRLYTQLGAFHSIILFIFTSDNSAIIIRISLYLVNKVCTRKVRSYKQMWHAKDRVTLCLCEPSTNNRGRQNRTVQYIQQMHT
jgi:hypothetical protein